MVLSREAVGASTQLTIIALATLHQLGTSRLFTEALKDVGTCEVPGRAERPVPERWFRDLNDWLSPYPTKTAWCGVVMAEWFRRANHAAEIPSAPYRAKSWASVGVPVTGLHDLRAGDIVVFSRAGGGHVALYSTKFVFGTPDVIEVLGGNQGGPNRGCVRTSTYPTDRILAIRRVPGDFTPHAKPSL